MKLTNLPKDMLVELVSKIQDRKEKEYSEYMVIYAGGSHDPTVWHFSGENELKAWILFRALNCPKEICNNENIWLFLEDLRKIPRNHYNLIDHRHTEFCKNNSTRFHLDELLILLNKINTDFVIIKGKCISGNTETIMGF